MTIWTSSKTVTFRRPFWLKGVDRLLAPADYRVATDEELIEGLSFSALPSLIDGNLCACTSRIRDRDGNHRSFGS